MSSQKNKYHKSWHQSRLKQKVNEQKKSKIAKIMVELNSDNINLESLRTLSLQKHGLVSQDIRSIVWPLLMNVYNIN